MEFKLNHISPDSEISLNKVLKETDIVLTDPTQSDLLNDKYISKYQITLERMNLIKENSLLNPCPPFFRNEKVRENVINSKYFVVYEFKKDLIYVQQAIILWYLEIDSIF